MFLEIIHKSEVSYLCCYQKRSYTESSGRSLNTQYLFPKIVKYQRLQWKVSRPSKAEQSKILGNIVINEQLSNQQNQYQKTATLKEAFL